MTITERYGVSCDAPTDCEAATEPTATSMGGARSLAHREGWATVRLGSVPMLARDVFDYCPAHQHLADEHPDAFQPTVERSTFRASVFVRQADAVPPFADVIHQAVTDAYDRARQAVIDQGGNPDEWLFDIDPDAPLGSIVITATPPTSKEG